MRKTEQQLREEIAGLERLMGEWDGVDDPQTQWALYLLGVCLDRRRAELHRLRIQPKTALQLTMESASALVPGDCAPEQPRNADAAIPASFDVRTLKVVRSFSFKPAAFLPLKGRWLERAGFVMGDHVQVHVQHKRLVITVLEGESR